MYWSIAYMNDFDWRNKPRTTTSPVKRNIVSDPLPIAFNGTTLSGTMVKPPNARIYKTKLKATP